MGLANPNVNLDTDREGRDLKEVARSRFPSSYWCPSIDGAAGAVSGSPAVEGAGSTTKAYSPSSGPHRNREEPGGHGLEEEDVGGWEQHTDYCRRRQKERKQKRKEKAQKENPKKEKPKKENLKKKKDGNRKEPGGDGLEEEDMGKRE